MTNRLPRALLSDIALAISLQDYTSAAAMLGPDEDFLASAVVAQYRGLVAAGFGDFVTAEAKLRESLALLALRADGMPRPDPSELERLAKGVPPAATPLSPALETVAPHVALCLVRRSLADLLERAGDPAKAEAERKLLPEAWRA